MSTRLLKPPKDKTREKVPEKSVHIEAPGQNAEWDREEGARMIVMLCGLLLTFDAEGNTIPKGEDFYCFEHGHKAECPACLETWLQLA